MTEKYGKEAYKMALDLELNVSNCQAKIDSIISQVQNLQTFVESFDPENFQNQLTELSGLIEQITQEQTSASQQISQLSSQTQQLASTVLSIQTQLNQKVDQTQLSNYVPVTRKINNKELNQDITLTFQDVGLQAMGQEEVDDYYEN